MICNFFKNFIFRWWMEFWMTFKPFQLKQVKKMSNPRMLDRMYNGYAASSDTSWWLTYPHKMTVTVSGFKLFRLRYPYSSTLFSSSAEEKTSTFIFIATTVILNDWRVFILFLKGRLFMKMSSASLYLRWASTFPYWILALRMLIRTTWLPLCTSP